MCAAIWPQQIRAENWQALCPFGEGVAGSPSNTMWPGPRPTCTPSFILIRRSVFGLPLVKRFALCYRTVVLCVCDVGVLWPNGWTDQDETSHAGRPRPWSHCVRWGHSFPSPKAAYTAPKFSAHICCGQMAAWINMPHGMVVGLDPDDFVLDENPIPSPKMGRSPLPNFRPISL